MDLLAFDIYFIENSERKLNYKALNAIADSVLSMDQVKNLFPNPDSDLANASEIAGNVTFAQSFKPQPKKKEKKSKRQNRRSNNSAKPYGFIKSIS
jgi:hypothetical protein